MTQVETIHRDSRSYRQGLVLGLTMAEVFLLLVFALLIALAALWSAERQKRVAAEAKLPGQVAGLTVADRQLFDDVRAAIDASSRDRVVQAIEHLRQGRALEPLTGPEKEFLTEARAQQPGATPDAISDDWRVLTRAAQNVRNLRGMLNLAEAVAQALPDEKDRSQLVPILGKGLAVLRRGGHDWPPIIPLSDASGYSFEKGKAELTPKFEAALRKSIIPQVLDLAKQFGVTVIEIIGHTDDQKIAPRPHNLDSLLPRLLHGTGRVDTLVPGDNAGLGLARAVAVLRVLVADGRLKGYTLLPLSGGQLIGSGDQLSAGGGGDEPDRRRIEIRLRRASTTQLPVGAPQPSP